MQRIIEAAETVKQSFTTRDRSSQLDLLRSTGQEWLNCCPERKMRQRLVGWLRQMDDSSIAAMSGNHEQTKEKRSAFGALAVIESSENLQNLASRALAQLPEDRMRAGQELGLLSQMLSDLSLEALISLQSQAKLQ